MNCMCVTDAIFILFPYRISFEYADGIHLYCQWNVIDDSCKVGPCLRHIACTVRPARDLQSSNHVLLIFTQFKTVIGSRTFCYSFFCNNVPQNIVNFSLSSENSFFHCRLIHLVECFKPTSGSLLHIIVLCTILRWIQLVLVGCSLLSPRCILNMQTEL